jgi:3-isopropylmalate dehydrogenase
MLLRHSLRLEAEAAAIEQAVADAIAAGARTPDIAAPGERAISTSEMTAEIIHFLS